MDGVWAAVGGWLLDVVVPSLVTAMAGLIVGVLVRQLQKLGLDVTAKQEARLRDVVADMIRAVEERSRREPLASRDKAALARALVQDQFPDVPASVVERAIDAALPVMRVATPMVQRGGVR